MPEPYNLRAAEVTYPASFPLKHRPVLPFPQLSLTGPPRLTRKLEGAESPGPAPSREGWIVLRVKENDDLRWHSGRVWGGVRVCVDILA